MDVMKMLSQARHMQTVLKRAQKQAAKTRVEGVAGDGLVRIVMSGDHLLRSVHLDARLKRRDVAEIEQLVGEALRDALKRVAAANKLAMRALEKG